jgi:5-methylcytosine-specific restriction protein A
MPESTIKRITDREHDSRRRAEKPWRAWYGSAHWQATCTRQLAEQPLCQRCLDTDVVTVATVWNHSVPRCGSADLFQRGPFSSACKPCHDSDDQRIENGGKARQVVGAEGWAMGQRTAQTEAGT